LVPLALQVRQYLSERTDKASGTRERKAPPRLLGAGRVAS
jgi:hypothetical protein